MIGDRLPLEKMWRFTMALTFLGVASLLQACVTSPTDALNISNPIAPPKNQLPADQPGVRKSGAFPTIGETPKAETKQLTEAEKAEIKGALAPATRRGSDTATKKAEAEYQRDIAEMQRLLAVQEQKRQAQ